ncbi:ArsR/SmtB family transcription factor [Salibacterium aidingense]|uniref:ArsR/SmtB family transcription factor n=1 Tax=Salibacterium aidingense TaxID=384933 RepID=UPI0004239623|nr:metalloregulator ArsR/SmtB family transcription factor [Salibacterium aidingense]
MSNYKIEINDIVPFSDMFKALSNPHRLQIFLYLANHCFPGELSTEEEMRTSVGELGEGLGIAPSTVSHHLKELRQAGLIRMERSGKNIECWVEPETLDHLVHFFQHAKGQK